MQTRTKKSLTTAALGLAAVAAAAGTASAADLTGGALGSLPLGQATGLIPGATASAAGTHHAITNGAAALPVKSAGLVPSGNHLSGNTVAPIGTLLGGLPAGAGLLGN
ncbi:ATP-binding protein [Actinacidiphila sp. ITFR-21]|uniref:ATP-binding protein n=1 Tax=Actinacidiphila sp. ITFR-21 TaxID=3075199 RepID=UPI00288BE82E|nr:ATP-binding protein [Streptomyces sp. ITFR-21]WNI17414.1 ATP-binding protein [Streptomyces sp. ITFR-21]